MFINFKFWWDNGVEEELSKEVYYIPDQIMYKEKWWKKTQSAYDFDTEEYTKVHYVQAT